MAVGTTCGLAVIETHPIQYHAPVYRILQERFRIPVTAVYGSDFSIAGSQDPEFRANFAWDTDLLSGYTPVFLSRTADGGARSGEGVSARGIGRILRQAAPSAVLLPGYSPRFYQIAFGQALRAGWPILFRGETTDHAVERKPALVWARSRALRWVYGKCAKLLYVGERSYRHFKRLGCPDEKLMFAPYCVDTTPFRWGDDERARLRPAIRKSFGIAESQTVLLFSGKLSARKGPDLLLLAMKELPPVVRERTVALFMGSGEQRSDLENLAQRPPSVTAHFLGFQNQTELSVYYHAADLLVLPSRHSETWGLVVNEALHHGVPCVVSEAVGCAPDLVRPGITGEVCETASLASLRSAILRALTLVGRSEVREQCRREAGAYTVDKAAAGIAEAYWAVTPRIQRTGRLA